MTAADDLGPLAALVRDHRLRRHHSMREAADAAGVSYASWRAIEAGNQRTPSDKTLTLLAAYTGERLPRLLALRDRVRAKTARRSTKTSAAVTRSLQSDPALDERARRILLDLYRLIVELSCRQPPPHS
jgi:transcriptional regulator with XRE-family HTH domain